MCGRFVLELTLYKSQSFRFHSDDHKFKDEYLFYSFRKNANAAGGSSVGSVGGGSTTGGSRNFTLGDQESVGSSEAGRNGQGSKDSASRLTEDRRSKFSHLQDKIISFRQCAVLQTGVYRWKKYPNVFIGEDTVDRMVYTGLAQSRSEAVQLGRALARECRLFKHVCNDHAVSLEKKRVVEMGANDVMDLLSHFCVLVLCLENCTPVLGWIPVLSFPE